jgi:hypothetical protein
MITKKTLQPTNDLYIQFTEEELSQIGAGPGTKFSVKRNDDGSIELRPYVKMEIEISDWSREVLEMLIAKSCEDDVSVNDVINELLKQSLDTKNLVKVSSKELLLEKDYLYSAGVNPDSTNSDTSITDNQYYCATGSDIIYKAPEEKPYYFDTGYDV